MIGNNLSLYIAVNQKVRGKAYKCSAVNERTSVKLLDYENLTAYLSWKETTFYGSGSPPENHNKGTYWAAENLIGKELKYEVISNQNGEVLLSRYSLGLKKLKEIKVGDVQTGTITNIFSFGVHVDVDGVRGLCPMEETSYAKGYPPSEFLKVGESYPFKVLVKKEDNTLILSFKQFYGSHQEAMEKYLLCSPQAVKIALLDRVNPEKDYSGIRSYFFYAEPIFSGIVEVPDTLPVFYGKEILAQLLWDTEKGLRAVFQSEL